MSTCPFKICCALPSSSPFKKATAPHNRNGLIHDPFTYSQITVDPRLNLLALADRGGFDAGGCETCASLDAGEESRDEDGVESVVCQASEHHREDCEYYRVLYRSRLVKGARVMRNPVCLLTGDV